SQNRILEISFWRDQDMNMPTVTWSELDEVARAAFRVWKDQPELNWAREAWHHLTVSRSRLRGLETRFGPVSVLPTIGTESLDSLWRANGAVRRQLGVSVASTLTIQDLPALRSV